MDSLLLYLSLPLDYFVEGQEWLQRLDPDQFVRVFWAVLFIEIPRYLFTNLYVFVLYFRDRLADVPPSELPPDMPLVSVIVPALNEEETIAYTIKSILEQDYANTEVVVVDDASRDKTAAICRELAARIPKLKFYSLQERQGKSAALNFGLKASRGKFVVFMDSDSTLDRDVISRIISYFKDERVGGVSGNLGVRNWHVNVLTRLQAMEYLIGITVGRRFKATADILSIVTGALGAFRRSDLDRVGVLEPGPGNDSDLTIRIRKLNKQIAFGSDATCLTNVPERWGAWFRQRMRWDRNIIRNRVRRHRDVFDVKQANFNLSNFLSFTDTLFFVVILPILWIIYFVDMLLHYPGEYGFVLFTIFAIHLLMNFIRILIALIVAERDFFKMDFLVWTPIYGVYRILLKLVRITAAVQEFLFRTSYRDPFAPEKVRLQMEVY